MVFVTYSANKKLLNRITSRRDIIEIELKYGAFSADDKISSFITLPFP